MAHGPAVRVARINVGCARVHHGLDGERHARYEHHAFAWLAHEAHERVFVEFEATAVSAVFTNDRIALRFGVFVYGGAHVAQQPPGLNGGKARFHGLLGFFNQTAAFGETSPMQNMRDESL